MTPPTPEIPSVAKPSPTPFTKAHAFGNDFLFVRHADVSGDAVMVARRICDRHRGIGADGLIVYWPLAQGVGMRLYNADGGVAELSGNGLRCLAAIVAREQGTARSSRIVIETDAGPRPLELLDSEGARYTFVAAMGEPADLRRVRLDVGDASVETIVMSMGNPQCVVLEPELSEARLHGLAAPLATHAFFPAGTNVELAVVEAPDRVRILIWERGVGPTEASGTGACAAAAAAIRFGGASPDLEVVSPGGSQRVEWRGDGLYLTGWAEIICEGSWVGGGA